MANGFGLTGLVRRMLWPSLKHSLLFALLMRPAQLSGSRSTRGFYVLSRVGGRSGVLIHGAPAFSGHYLSGGLYLLSIVGGRLAKYDAYTKKEP
ncbi:MAG: hypothetical protein GX031_10005 [Candidatus Riflebacteria bacterium]|nr:hypothetical protein [Candidatus Riflebacteria bacterium]